MHNFTIKLGSITNGKNSFSFEIEDQFFEAFTFSDVEHANISAIATLDKDGENISLNLTVDGQINQLACDICTDELSVQVSGETDVIIKTTDEDVASTDDIFYIKKSENKLDLQHLIFELIVLNAPKKRQHALDKQGNSTCNKEMVDLVKEYTQIKEKSSDPRWDALKSLK
ncbi:MAG: DUF177 domain-containing protein [Bacteroidota bacterium]|nr:DUF177 domain-containing protein [Bacteroidota bacterium]